MPHQAAISVTITFESDVQPKNAPSFTKDKVEGTDMETRSEQPANAWFPMLVTEYVTPLYVTVSGMLTVPVYLLGFSVTSACFYLYVSSG
jgi:hypothetical protein